LQSARAKGVVLGRPIRGNTQEIASLRAQGLSIRAIAKRTELSPTAVANKLKSAQKPVHKTHAKMRARSAHE
jgi:DNA-binding NarL/FixJ family response regulator